MTGDPAALISRKTGDWWQDDRRNWCAYCGLAILKLSGKATNPAKATRDHVIPRAHKGRHVTIPCCKECNQRKGKVGLPEFILTDYFAGIRETKHPHQWSLCNLWLVMAMAAVEQAKDHAATWPAEVKEPAKSKAKAATRPTVASPRSA